MANMRIENGSVYTVEAFFEYVKKARSKNTVTMYRQGLVKFSKWYGKDLNTILAERRADWKSDDMFTKKRFAQKVEEFHAYLKRGHTPSSAATLTQGIKSLFAYYEMPLPVSRETSKQAPTTRDFVPRVDQYQAMFKTCNSLRDRLILSMGLNLAWRIGDFVSIRKAELPDLNQEAPITFERITEKEGVIAKSFLSAETVELLREYLATKSDRNPYLFASNGVGHVDKSTINRMLQALAEKAGLPTPSGQRIRSHCFRKRFLSECANLRIDVNIAKLLVGKDVERSMLAYLSGVDLREAFLKVSERLRLSEKRMVTTVPQETSELLKRLDRLERKQNLIAAMSPALDEWANKELERLLADAPLTEKYKMEFKRPKSTGEKLDRILKFEELKKTREQAKEYEGLIAENNGENGDE